MSEILQSILKLLIAAVLGLIIGANRERFGKPAGYKTIFCVAVASCLLVILSRDFGETGVARMAAQIVPGVGFIGAGVIFKGDRIVDLTTAAAILLSAAIGISCYTFEGAILGAFTVLLYLTVMHVFKEK